MSQRVSEMLLKELQSVQVNLDIGKMKCIFCTGKAHKNIPFACYQTVLEIPYRDFVLS